MKERPIIFSEPMVRAILVGRKTQTRRVVKQVPHWQHCGRDIMEWGLSDCYTDDKGSHWLDIQTHVDDNSHDEIKCPFGQHGDRLWVRETWNVVPAGRPAPLCGATEIPKSCPDGWGVMYQASGDRCTKLVGWRPSIHMPRWASRLTLEITAVRVERLQGISEEDAVKEGVVPFAASRHTPANFRDGFTVLWQSIYGPGSWDANPFVWVLEFKRVEEVK